MGLLRLILKASPGIGSPVAWEPELPLEVMIEVDFFSKSVRRPEVRV